MRTAPGVRPKPIKSSRHQVAGTTRAQRTEKISALPGKAPEGRERRNRKQQFSPIPCDRRAWHSATRRSAGSVPTGTGRKPPAAGPAATSGCRAAIGRKRFLGGIVFAPSARRMRTATSKVFEATVDWNLSTKSARRIQTGDRAAKAENPYLRPEEEGRLITSLPEPCRAPVRIAVLTGLRIGDLLALRWVDFIRDAILVRASSAERRRRAAKGTSRRADRCARA